MTTMDEATVVSVGGGAGLITWKVLTWMRAAERLGVRFSIIDDELVMEPGLPPISEAFIQTHASELRRLVLATPPGVM